MKIEQSFKLRCILPCLMADLLFLSYEVFASAFSIQRFPPHRTMWVEVCWVSTATSECHSFSTAPRRACLIPKSTDSAMWVAAKTKCTCLNKDDKLGAVLERITSLLLIIQLHHGPSLPNLFKKGKDSDQEESSTGAEEETSFGSEYSEGKRVRREYY